MKKALIFALLTVAVIIAQTQNTPEPIDHRFSFSWEDSNPPGLVAQWSVCVTNPVTGFNRTFVSRVMTIDCLTILNGAPAGTYGLYTTAISTLGDVSEPSTNKWISWPGGNGKTKPGHGHKVGKNG